MATANSQGFDQTAAEKQFTGVLKDAGFELEQDAIMDGKWHRVPVDGDKGKQTSGSYRGFLDGIRPAGVYRNFKKDGSAISWKYEGEATQLTTEDRARIETNRREREVAQQRQYEERADYTAGMVAKLSPASSEHPYLLRKQVSSHGLLQDKYGNLVMPLQDVDGKIWSTQRIKPDGEKMFTKDGRTHGLYYQVGVDDPSKPNIIVEGYATGATIHELSGLPVKVALNKGNLREVAFSLSVNEPNRPIIVSGDNDHEKVGQINPKTNQPYVNGGKIASEETAAFIGNQVRVALVQFEHGQLGTDWNDLAVNYGKEIAREQMQAAFGLELDKSEQEAQQEAQQEAYEVELAARDAAHDANLAAIEEEGRHDVSPGELKQLNAESAQFNAASADTAVHSVAEASAQYEGSAGQPGAGFVALEPSRFSAAMLATELEAMDARIRELADAGHALSPKDRAIVVATAEASIAKTDTYAVGSDRLANALNAMPEPHQRAAMGLARTLAAGDAAGSNVNPFENENLKAAYHRERAFQERMVRDRSAAPESRAVVAERPGKPSHAPPSEVKAEVAQTYLNANDVISRRKASEVHPVLRNAFALEAALSKFAEESLPPVMAVRFMTAQKELIAGKLRSGDEIPTVRVREQHQVAQEETEH